MIESVFASTSPVATAGGTSINFLHLIGQAGIVGQAVMAFLLLCSVWSWTIIFGKWRHLKAADSQNSQFLDLFWKSKNIDEVFAKSDFFALSTVAKVFRSGLNELKKQEGGPVHLESVQRSLLRSSTEEVANLEKNVSWLATTASATPFIGLFGTVWGIMSSFHDIGATGSANLSVVAPGISEALITTAIGIAAAVPAVIAYNAFANRIKRAAIEMDCFTNDFLNLVQRSMKKE